MPSVERDDDVATTLLAADPPATDGPSGARLLAGFTATVALVAVATTGLLLGRRYVPEDRGVVPLESGDWSRQLVQAHELAMIIAVAAVGVWALLAMLDSHGGARRARGLVRTGAAAGALVLAVVTWLTWSRVAYDQIALWAVTVGNDLEGLVWAAFSGQDRFVIVDGAEITQDAYARWVVVHLASPVLALVAMGVTWLCARDPADS